MLIFKGTNYCGAPECCMSAMSIQLHQPENAWNEGWIKGGQIQSGVEGSRGAVLVIGEYVAVCVLVNLKSVVCVLCHTSCLCQAKRRKGCGCPGLCLVCVLCVAAIESCLWLPVHPASSVSPVCVWDMCSTLLLVEPVSGKAAAASEPGQRAQVPWAQGKSLFNE